jgi:hypothetical protein
LGWRFNERTYPILDLRRASSCSSRNQYAPVTPKMARFPPGGNRFLGAGESGTVGDSIGNDPVRRKAAPALFL